MAQEVTLHQNSQYSRKTPLVLTSGWLQLLESGNHILKVHFYKGTLCLVNIHLHTAVCHGHGIVGQSVTRDLAVIGAADRGEGAHVVGVEGIPSLVGSGRVTQTDVTLMLQLFFCETVSNRSVTFVHV